MTGLDSTRSVRAVTETSIFTVAGDTYAATPAARGPWSPDALHGGAPSALLAGAIERFVAGTDMRVASIHLTFLGEVPMGPLRVAVELEKPGRRQQVVGAALTAGERTVLRARAVLLRRGDVPLPAGVGQAPPVLTPPDGGTPMPPKFAADPDAVGFVPTSMEILGQPPAGEPFVDAWFRLRLPILPGEEPSPLQRAAAAADFGNGITEPVPFADYLFVNCDLYVALQRDPAGAWIGLRAQTAVDPVGAGVTTTELHDERGRFGTAIQTLFVNTR
jgi:hypothetical protein